MNFTIRSRLSSLEVRSYDLQVPELRWLAVLICFLYSSVFLHFIIKWILSSNTPHSLQSPSVWRPILNRFSLNFDCIILILLTIISYLLDPWLGSRLDIGEKVDWYRPKGANLQLFHPFTPDAVFRETDNFTTSILNGERCSARTLERWCRASSSSPPPSLESC